MSETDQAEIDIKHALKLRDITWGGRIRRSYQSQVWAIAEKAATCRDTTFTGSMVSSKENISLRFLDGGVSNSRGYFDASSGMRWHGDRAIAYVLYKLGAHAPTVLKRPSCPTIEELESELGAERSHIKRPTELAGTSKNPP